MRGGVFSGGLAGRSGGWECGRGADTGGVEGVGADFAGVAAGGDFFAVEQEADASGIAGANDDFVGGANAGVGGGDQSFAGHGLTVGGNRDPGSLGGADDQRQRLRGLWRDSWSVGLGDGKVAVFIGLSGGRDYVRARNGVGFDGYGGLEGRCGCGGGDRRRRGLRGGR